MNILMPLFETVKDHQQKRKLKFVFGISYHTCARAFISLLLHILNDYRQTIHRLVIKLTTTKLLKQDDTEMKIILLARIQSKNICLMSLLKNKYSPRVTSKHQSFRKLYPIRFNAKEGSTNNSHKIIFLICLQIQ